MSLAALAVAMALLQPAPAQACAYDREQALALPMADFDQGRDGWRKVALPGCEATAAELIAAYRARHRARLTPDDLDGLDWHEGQLWALAGDDARAIPLLSRWLTSPFEAQRHYAEATIAFLKKDRADLLAARNALAAVPKDPQFEAAAAQYKARSGRTITWPPNLDIVDALIACFGRPYREAYPACRAAP